MSQEAGEEAAELARDADGPFRDAVHQAASVDPMPTFEALARNTGLAVDEVVHYALVRYASAGAEVLLALEPQALRELISARKDEDWEKVAGIIDWLEAGLARPAPGIRPEAASS